MVMDKQYQRERANAVYAAASLLTRVMYWFTQCPGEIMGAVAEKLPNDANKVAATFNTAKSAYDNLIKYAGFAKAVAKEAGK